MGHSYNTIIISKNNFLQRTILGKDLKFEKQDPCDMWQILGVSGAIKRDYTVTPRQLAS